MTVNAEASTRENGANREPQGNPVDTMRTLIEASSRWFGDWTAANNEMIAAFSRQMEQNAVPGLALPGAALLHDVLARQIDYGHATTRQYLETTQTLLRLGTDAMVQSWTGLRQAAETIQRASGLPFAPPNVTRDDVAAPPRAEAA